MAVRKLPILISVPKNVSTTPLKSGLPTRAAINWPSTSLVKDVLPGSSGSSPSQLTVWNNALYFFASNSNGGTDLWQSDGTEAGTASVISVLPTINPQAPFTPTLASGGGQLLFPAQTDAAGIELWTLGGCPSACDVLLPMIAR